SASTSGFAGVSGYASAMTSTPGAHYNLWSLRARRYNMMCQSVVPSLGLGGLGVARPLLGVDGRAGRLPIDLDANLFRRARTDLGHADRQQPVLDRGLGLLEPAVAWQRDLTQVVQGAHLLVQVLAVGHLGPGPNRYHVVRAADVDVVGRHVRKGGFDDHHAVLLVNVVRHRLAARPPPLGPRELLEHLPHERTRAPVVEAPTLHPRILGR